MIILVIGSEGFIGKSCKKHFTEQGHIVFSCDIFPYEIENYFEINSDAPDFAAVFKKTNPDVCINASGSANVGFSLQHPERDYELNVKNVERILEAMKKYSPACKLINFSSAAVYGNPQLLPVNESAEINPLSIYGKNKYKSEATLLKYNEECGLKTCSMRVFSAYGVGLKKQLFWDIYQKSQIGKIVKLFGTGEESRDFIFIDDLVHSIDCIVQNADFKGEAINVSSGVETKIKDAGELFLSCLGEDFKLKFSGEEKQGDPKNWKADISKLKRMGFIPFVTFEQGIKKYAEWLKELE